LISLMMLSSFTKNFKPLKLWIAEFIHYVLVHALFNGGV